MALRGQEDLLAYLAWLEDALRGNNEQPLAAQIEFSIRFASGSASEFLHEAACALREVRKKSNTLSAQQLDDVSSGIAQIEEAFRAIGGA